MAQPSSLAAQLRGLSQKKALARDCHGFEKPMGKCHRLVGVGVWVMIFDPMKNLYPQ